MNFSCVIKGTNVVLRTQDFTNEIDVDELTKIDYSNIFGEIVTVSALLNRIGILKAEIEGEYERVKLDCEIYYADLAKKYRREANINSGKFTFKDLDGSMFEIKLTEDSLQNTILLDPIYQNKRKSLIEVKKDLGLMDSIYWAIQSKDRKLSVLMKPVTPEEFVGELVFGRVVNSFLISKVDM